MRAGNLRNQIVIKTLTESPDGAGGYTGTYSAGKTIWAKIRAQNGFRSLEDSRINLDNLFEFTIRYDDFPEISQLNKIVYNSGEYTIKSFKVVQERKKEIIIMATLGRTVSSPEFILTESAEFLITERSGN